MRKQMGRYVDDARKLQKTTECYRRVEECGKASLIICLDSWKYWCAD